MNYWQLKYGIMTGFLIVFAFGLPPLLKLKKTPPSDVLPSKMVERLKLNPGIFVLHIVIFGLVLLLVVFLSLLRQSLFYSWQDELPEKTPNYFVINISKSQVDSFENKLIDKQISSEDLYPLVRGRIIKAFPNITLIDVDDMIDRIRAIVDKANLAINFIVFFMLLVGVVVLYSSVQLTIKSREHENAIFRAIGATHNIVRMNLIIEFITLGIISGFIAAVCATLSSWAISAYMFNIPYRFVYWPFWVTPLAGSVLICAVGLLSTRPVLRASPMCLLRISE